MKIPNKFKAILDQHQDFNGIVLDTITSFEPIYKDNKLYFFEEYTDHGIKHVESVLESAEFIISDTSFKNLTPKDVAVFILAVLLHDIGMHIEFATFNSLLKGDYDQYRIPSLGTKTWIQLWNEYLTEVKRFSSSQKQNIFGNDTLPFNEPDLSNKDNLNGYDKKLIGEFIRRHHARLAHEIAFGGIFGTNGSRIQFGNEKLPHLYRQLIGVIARSHGIHLRGTFKHLEDIANQGWRNPDDINVVFLMVVLRIADYIQIDKHRVSPYLLKLKTFNSPISLKEHNTHLAITSISFNQPDSERIYVSCDPKSSEMLTKLKKLLNDIQNELDISWATLGEVYGFLQNDKPHIKFRRITSNIEDSTFLEKLPFVPKKVHFEVNNELSKLLVGPLYGNEPIYGVRELLQNAVDACLERYFLEQKAGNLNYIPKITVSISQINGNTSLFKIIDNGKGMSLNEILYYFLSVGTSFRKSLTWKKDFVDDAGHSLITRNGKFGIGVLAAFLLGNELEVETIHYSNKVKYFFSTKIDNEYIEILKESTNNGEVGTTISLIISNQIRHSLTKGTKNEWTNWFIYDFPTVEYYLDGKQIMNEAIIDQNQYNSLTTDDFKKILWKYTPSKNNYYYKTENPFFACNGIFVTNLSRKNKSSFAYDDLQDRNYVIHEKPNILIEDRDGIFPLKLDRNDIDCDKLPFEEILLKEISKEFIAQILTLKVDVSKEIGIHNIKYHHCKLIFSNKGYSLDFDYFVDQLKSQFSFIKIITSENLVTNEFLQFEDCFFYPVFNEKINLTYQERNLIPNCSARILLKKDRFKQLFDPEKKRMPLYVKKAIRIEFEDENIVIYNFKRHQSKAIILKNTDLLTLKLINPVESIQEIEASYFTRKGGNILNSLLKEYIGSNVVIPYKIEDRKNLYKKAFKELRHFMKS